MICLKDRGSDLMLVFCFRIGIPGEGGLLGPCLTPKIPLDNSLLISIKWIHSERGQFGGVDGLRFIKKFLSFICRFSIVDLCQGKEQSYANLPDGYLSLSIGGSLPVAGRSDLIPVLYKRQLLYQYCLS
jgi:hypothetical protein